MKHASQRIAQRMLALGMLLGACSPAATPDPGMAAAAGLDAAVNRFLSGMQDYNVLRMDPFVEMLAQDPAPFLLDVRELSEVETNGHIPGAVVIPLRELGDHLDMLPAFDQPIVAYCGSGWRCSIAMTALGMLGWQRALSLQDDSFGGYREGGNEVAAGLPVAGVPLDAAHPAPALVLAVDTMLKGLPQGWGAITVEELAADLGERPDLVLIDIRTQAEIDRSGSIEAENALAIPIEELAARRAEWPAESEASIVAYSGSGHRSTIAMTILRTYGYTNARSLKGGLGAWVEAGYPVAQVPTP
jgi:rhodanese-related sulfurtransferase